MCSFVAVSYNWCIPRTPHDISKLFLCSFSFQISLESSVSVLYFFCFLKNFHGLLIVTWTWSHWCHRKFYFCNYLSLMLYLPCKNVIIETHLGLDLDFFYFFGCFETHLGIWICYMFLLELTLVGLFLPCYVCWFLISCFEYNCVWLSYCFCWRFWKTSGVVESACSGNLENSRDASVV